MPRPRLTFVHAAAAWCVILVSAVINGGVRESLLIPRLGLVQGTALSGVLLIVAIAGVTWLLVRWRAPRTRSQTWLVGTGWLAATLSFEFVFGGFVQQKPWAEILDAYTFKNGNLWPLVLVAVLVSPYVLGRRAVFEQHARGTDA